MNGLYTYIDKKIVPISECSKDEYMQELLDTEY